MRWIFHADAGRLCGQNIYYYLRENMAIHAAANIAMAVENFKTVDMPGLADSF